MGQNKVNPPQPSRGRGAGAGPQGLPAVGADVSAMMPAVGQDVTSMMGGPGPGNAPNPSTALPGYTDPLKRPGAFLKENLPMLGGIAGSGAAALATGGMSIPVQIAAGLGAGAIGAGTGDAMRQGINIAQGIPNPPDQSGFSSIAKSALTEGVVPELTGQAFGIPTRFGGHVVSRFGARGRNRTTVARTANPDNLKMSAGAREVGKQTQIPLKREHMAAKDPLEKQYSELLSGPWGQSRRLDYAEGGYNEPLVHESNQALFTIQDPPPPRVIDEGPNAFTVQEDPTWFSVTERGPTNAQRHQRRSDLLEDARGAAKRDDPKQARRDRARADQQLREMKQAAKDNGLSMQEYTELTQAWAQMTDQFDNNFMKQLKNNKGSNVIDLLLNPKQWKTRLGTPDEFGVAVPLDNPELLLNLKANLPDQAYRRLQIAVQKAIVRRATDMHGDIRPTQLDAQLKRMIDYGAHDLVPNAAELRQIARILDSGKFRVPHVNRTAGWIDRGLHMIGLDVPDVARSIKLDKKGGKGTGQKAMEWLGRLGSGALTVDTDIPEPPQR